VGVDIEESGRRPSPELARRLAPDEQEWLTPWSDQRFLGLWTKKEAYLKMLGTGIAGGLRTFSALRPEDLGVRFEEVAAPGIVGAICIRTAP
jgi:4'-phosphopantetheinyl transferase